MSHLSDLRNRINTPARDFLSTLTAGEHGCIFFASKKVMQDLQFAFVKSGLEDNWGVVYATSTESVEQIRDAMQKYGIDTVGCEACGNLIVVKGEDLY